MGIRPLILMKILLLLTIALCIWFSIFLDILSHETIRAQSCFTGSRIKTPQRIGLPLEYSKDLNLNLSHNLYSNKPEEVLNVEREAFTYSKVKGVAIKLLNNFCE